jgi:hypothetical protein
MSLLVLAYSFACIFFSGGKGDCGIAAEGIVL